MKKVLKKIAVAAAIAGAFTVASATPVVGVANLTIGQVVIRAGSVDWNNDPLNINPPPNGAAITRGDFAVINTRTGSFLAGTPVFSAGTIRDLADPTIIPGDTGNAFPVGVATDLNKFLTFAAQPNWLFHATFLVPGTFGSPFTLTQVGANVFASMTVNGYVCDDTNVSGSCDIGEDLTHWTGGFSAQYNNTTPNNLFGILVGGGALQNNTWSATIEATALPEPGSMALLGLGLVGLAATRRRIAKTVK